jgi:hypothetical protein
MRRQFPNLASFDKTSEVCWRYNCHAWGAADDSVWWEPAAENAHPYWPWMRIYWPTGLQLQNYTLENFRAAHATEGFVVCGDGSLELGSEKIAHYGRSSYVTHTARQLDTGEWTSKLGPGIDISHQTPEELEGPLYGNVIGFMRRPRTTNA